VAVATLWDALVTGEATAAETAAGLVSVLDVETAPGVIEPYLKLAGNAAEFWSPEDDRATIAAQVAAVCRRLAEHPSRRRVALRALAGVTTDVDELTAAVGDDVDLEWRMLVRKSELGGSTEAESAALLARDPDPDAWVRALAVRAAAPDAAAKAEAWRALVDREVPIAGTWAVTAAFWRPGQDELLAEYADKYVDLLPTLQRGGMIPQLYYSLALFPVFAIDEAYLTRVGEAAAAEDVTPVVRKTVAERSDEVARMLRSRKLEKA
jgi:aminopeptidase N